MWTSISALHSFLGITWAPAAMLRHQRSQNVQYDLMTHGNTALCEKRSHGQNSSIDFTTSIYKSPSPTTKLSHSHDPSLYLPVHTLYSAVFVTVDVTVAVSVATLDAVLVTVVSAGPFVIKHEQALEIAFGPLSPRLMLIPPGSPMLMLSCRLRTGSSAGQVTS
jgi:hypothetical protein